MSVLNLAPASSFITFASPSLETDNGPLYDAISHIYQEVLNANFFQYLQQKAVWAWNATIEALKSEWMMVTLVAFGVFAAFGFTAAVQSALVFASARLALVAWQDQGGQKDMERLRGENLSLRLRNEELAGEMEIERHRAQHAQGERDLHKEEAERVRLVRDDLIRGRAPILNENDQLREANAVLLHEKGQLEAARLEMDHLIQHLQQERDAAVQAQEDQQGVYQRAIQNAEQFGEQLGRVDTFENFNRILAELKEIYQERQGHIPPVKQQLFDQYKAIRTEWNQKLSDLIQTLNPNSKERIRLERILAVSQGELEHLEGFYAVMQLHIAYQAQQMRQAEVVERQPALVAVRV